MTELHSLIARDIILDRRQYFYEKVKSPLMKALVWAFDKRGNANIVLDKILLFIAVWNVMQAVNRFPEPTKENCEQPLIHALIDIWDEFFKWEDNPEHPDADKHPFFGRVQLWRALRRASIGILEHDNYYRQRGHWLIEKIVKAYLDNKIPPLLPVMPDRRVCWNEPVENEKLLSWLEWQKYRTDNKIENIPGVKVTEAYYGN